VSLEGSDDGPNKIACSIAFPLEENSGIDHGDLVDPAAFIAPRAFAILRKSVLRMRPPPETGGWRAYRMRH
jgi:hypothetical protein